VCTVYAYLLLGLFYCRHFKETDAFMDDRSDKVSFSLFVLPMCNRLHFLPSCYRVHLALVGSFIIHERIDGLMDTLVRGVYYQRETSPTVM
jgi:hypothetical protein